MMKMADEAGNAPIYKLKDGTEVSLGELRSAYIMHRDCAKRNELLAADRRELDSLLQAYTQALQKIRAQQKELFYFCRNLIPEKPDPELARTNPSDYQKKIAIRKKAIKEIRQVLQWKKKAHEVEKYMHQFHYEKMKETEKFKLLNAMPWLLDPSEQAQFMQQVREAGKEFGFSDQEMEGVYDHRLFLMMYHAYFGKQAKKNQH